MTTQRLFNLARMTVSSSGVGVVTLNSAVSGFATFAQTGVPAAGTVSYAISDTNQSEIGVGIYSSGGGLTLGATGGGATRTPIMNHTGTSSAINMSNAAQIFITPNVTDWPWLLDVAGTTATCLVQQVIQTAVATNQGYQHEQHSTATSPGNLAHMARFNWGNNTEFPAIRVFKSKSGTIGTHAAVAVNNGLGAYDYGGSDGTAFVIGAGADAYCDDTVSLGVLPTRLSWFVTNSAGTLFEGMRLNKDAGLSLAPSGGIVTAPTGVRLYVLETGATATASVRAETTNAGAGAFAEMQAKSNTGINALGLQTLAGGGACYVGPTGTNAPLGIWSNLAARITISTAGAVAFPSIGTTATAANAFLDSGASNNLLRSTSSVRFKRDIEPASLDAVNAVLQLRPVRYRSKASKDNPDWSFYGLLAEDVAKVDPRLVSWAYLDEDYDEVRDEIGRLWERNLKPDARLVPDGVQYDRVAIMQIAALTAKVEELESKLGI